MSGIDRHPHGFFGVVGVVPVSVFLQFVPEYPVDEVLNGGVRTVFLALLDNAGNGFGTELFDAAERPEDSSVP